MDNIEELKSLIKYLIDHNHHHNEELIELASTLKDINCEAFDKVNEAIVLFNNGNEALKNALKELNK